MKIHEVDIFNPDRSKASIIWALAWPSIVEQVLAVTVNYVDSAMVGSLGAEATAAISVSTSTIWLISGLMNSLAVGYSVLMAQALGAKKTDKARSNVKQGLFAYLVFGIAITLLLLVIAKPLPRWLKADPAIWNASKDYLVYIGLGSIPTMMMVGVSNMIRLSGDTRTPLLLAALNNIINIGLNYLFIFHLALGVKGAAIATSLSFTITGTLLFLTLFQKQRNITILDGNRFSLHKKTHRLALRLALPVALERSILSFGQIALTAMVSTLGVKALAAHFLANTAEQLTFLPPYGIAIASTTLVAQTLGAGKREEAKEFADTCVKWGFLFMCSIAVVMYIFAPEIISIFTPDKEVIKLGAAVLRIEAFAEPGFALSLLISGIWRGAEDTKRPFYITVIGMWGIRIPFAYLLLKTTSLGLRGCWIAMMSDLSLRGIISLVLYKRGNWLYPYKRSKAV